MKAICSIKYSRLIAFPNSPGGWGVVAVSSCQILSLISETTCRESLLLYADTTNHPPSPLLSLILQLITPSQYKGRHLFLYSAPLSRNNILFYYFSRVQQVHEKWVNIRTLLQTKLINILNIHTNPDFKFLAECTEWVTQKLVSSPQPY